MSIVELWKASQAATIKSVSGRFACGIFVVCVETRCAAPCCHIKRSNFSSLFNKISPACPPVFHTAPLARIQQFDTQDCRSGAVSRNTQRAQGDSAKGTFELLSGQEIYWRASIRRVMVRFKSLSDRRISSILLMECSTVV